MAGEKHSTEVNREQVNTSGDGSLLNEVIRQSEKPSEQELSSLIRHVRRWAHGRGLVMEGLCDFRSLRFTGFGKSENPIYQPYRHRITTPGSPPEGLECTKDELQFFTDNSSRLMEIQDQSGATLHPNHDWSAAKFVLADHFKKEELVEATRDLRGEWSILVQKRNRQEVAAHVVRFGDGKDKHYILYARGNHGFSQVFGPPPFDLPLFGSEDLPGNDKLVIVHEGPKGLAWRGMVGLPRSMTSWLGNCIHVAWHGSTEGIPWTDWSSLRGRRVLIWPDMDAKGVANARLIANRLALMGNVVSYINWEDRLMDEHPGWDLGEEKAVPGLTRSSINGRLEAVESPFDGQGSVLEEWCARSFVDEKAGEVYQAGDCYAVPTRKEVIRDRYGAKAWNAILKSPFNPYKGSVFLPGIRPGKVEGGLLNDCPPSRRAHIPPVSYRNLPSPIRKEIRTLHREWFRVLVPDVHQRRYLMRRIALALAAPEKVPNSMIILRGLSGGGKSVLLDFLVAAVGKDRAISTTPDNVLGQWTQVLARKSLVALHELHGTDMSKRNVGKKFKDLVGNSVIDIFQKNRDSRTVPATIHWFAATNEKVPFVLERGNDRYYIVDCWAPENAAQKRRLGNFMATWHRKLTKDSPVVDSLVGVAKYLISHMDEAATSVLTQRVQRQSSWAGLEAGEGLLPWQQEVVVMMERFAATRDKLRKEDREKGLFFIADWVINKTQRLKNPPGPLSVRSFLGELGYCALVQKKPKLIIRRKRIKTNFMGVESSHHPTLWCHVRDYGRLITLNDASFVQYSLSEEE